MDKSALEVIITEHNAVVLLFLEIQNRGKKACLAALMWLRQQQWICVRGITINLFLQERIRNRRM